MTIGPYSEMIRRAAMPQTPGINNGTVAGGLGHILEKAMDGYLRGKDKRQQKDAMKALASALGGIYGMPTDSTPAGTLPGGAPGSGMGGAAPGMSPASFGGLPSQVISRSVLSPQPQPQGGGPAQAPAYQQSQASGGIFDAITQQESGGRADAISPKGARGLMQVMPPTAMDPGYGVPSIFDLAAQHGVQVPARDEATAKQLLMDPDLNKAFGQRYYGAMRDHYGSDELALAAYNGGPGSVDKWTGTIGDPRQGQISTQQFVQQIPYKETREYVPGVLGRMGGQPAPQPQPGPQMAPPAPAPMPQPQSPAAAPQPAGNPQLQQLVQLAQAGNPYALQALQQVMTMQQAQQQQQGALARDERDFAFRQQQHADTMAMQQQRLASAQMPEQGGGVDFGSGVDGRALAIVTEIETKRRQGIPLSPAEEVQFQAASAHLSQPKFHVDPSNGRIVQTGGLSPFGGHGGGQPAPAQGGPAMAGGAPGITELPMTAKEQRQQEAAAANTDATEMVVGDEIRRAKELIGPLTTGIAGGLLRNLGGTDADALNRSLNTIKANVGFETLAKMRAASPTGGALGAVSEMENRMLQQALGDLDNSQRGEDLAYNLDRLAFVRDRIVHGPEAAMRKHASNPAAIEMMGGRQGGAPAQPAAAGVSSPKTEAEYNALPSGTRYIHPADGKERVKP